MKNCVEIVFSLSLWLIDSKSKTPASLPLRQRPRGLQFEPGANYHIWFSAKWQSKSRLHLTRGFLKDIEAFIWALQRERFCTYNTSISCEELRHWNCGQWLLAISEKIIFRVKSHLAKLRNKLLSTLHHVHKKLDAVLWNKHQPARTAAPETRKGSNFTLLSPL